MSVCDSFSFSGTFGWTGEMHHEERTGDRDSDLRWCASSQQWRPSAYQNNVTSTCQREEDLCAHQVTYEIKSSVTVLIPLGRSITQPRFWLWITRGRCLINFHWSTPMLDVNRELYLKRLVNQAHLGIPNASQVKAVLQQTPGLLELTQHRNGLCRVHFIQINIWNLGSTVSGRGGHK